MKKYLKLGTMLHGVGGNTRAWRHSEIDPNASISFLS